MSDHRALRTRTFQPATGRRAENPRAWAPAGAKVAEAMEPMGDVSCSTSLTLSTSPASSIRQRPCPRLARAIFPRTPRIQNELPPTRNRMLPGQRVRVDLDCEEVSPLWATAERRRSPTIICQMFTAALGTTPESRDASHICKLVHDNTPGPAGKFRS